MPYRQINLVSNELHTAKTVDANSRNPIGIVSFENKLFVANNLSSTVSVYSLTGSLIQTITTPPTPTGLAVNRTRGAFLITPTTSTTPVPARIIVVTQGGVIAGWNPQASVTAFIPAPVTPPPSGDFFGVTIVPRTPTSDSPLLFVTNFSAGVVQMYSSNWALLSTFTDSSLSSMGYNPFNIVHFYADVSEESSKHRERKHKQNDDSDDEDCDETRIPLLLVTFARFVSTSTTPIFDTPGPGNGYIDIFSATGLFISRYASRGPLNSPYGVVVGKNMEGILVASHGDGTVIKYTTRSFFSSDTGSTVFVGEYETPIRTPCDGVILNEEIWGLTVVPCRTNEIFFTAGINPVLTPTFTVDGLVGVFVTADDDDGKGKQEKRIVEFSNTLKQQTDNKRVIPPVPHVPIFPPPAEKRLPPLLKSTKCKCKFRRHHLFYNPFSCC